MVFNADIVKAVSELEKYSDAILYVWQPETGNGSFIAWISDSSQVKDGVKFRLVD